MAEITTQYSVKYRPHVWEDVIGQDFIVKSLRKRTLEDNFPKATLFVGPYGTGKTSIAEILAACMQASLPDGNPDWDNPSCKSILNETFDGDTQRLDGSQIGGKTDVVDFVATAKLPPMYDRKRIFIIEEADQLSTSAKNALLKALEDKSPNVHFILLSMMDKGGLPPAIKSRCQVFNVKSLGIKDTMIGLMRIMKKAELWEDESIPDTFRTEGLSTIAMASEGSMRMAVQNLETCLLGEIYDPKDIEATISTVNEMSSFKILQGLLEKSKDEGMWRKIFDSEAMQLYNYMTVLLSEALLVKQTGFVYEDRQGDYLRAMANSPNVELLYFDLILHPQMNKPFMRTADLIGALVSYYQGFDFRNEVKHDMPIRTEEPISVGAKEAPEWLKPEEKPQIATRTVKVRSVPSKNPTVPF